MRNAGAFKRVLYRSMVASVPIVALLAFAGPSPAGAEPDPPTCDPISAADITAVLTPDGHATITVGNTLPLCDPVPIGVALYLKDAEGFVVPQALLASATATITSGSKELSVTVPTTGTKPHCFTQLDAFTGAPLPQITETEQYGPRLLAYLWGEVPTCAEVGGETITQPPLTPETPPAAVEAVEVIKAPAPNVETQPTVLARTGPRQRIEPLLAASGWLLILGGSCLALSTRRPRLFT
jgi:hypothetical protein